MNLKKYNKKVNEMVDKTISAVGKDVSDYDDVDRQLVCAVIFGMVNAFSMEKGIDPIQTQGAVIGFLINKFHYPEEQASDFFDFLVRCTNPEYHKLMNVIIHKGIDAYQYLDNPQVMGKNINDMINMVKEAQK